MPNEAGPGDSAGPEGDWIRSALQARAPETSTASAARDMLKTCMDGPPARVVDKRQGSGEWQASRTEEERKSLLLRPACIASRRFDEECVAANRFVEVCNARNDQPNPLLGATGNCRSGNMAFDVENPAKHERRACRRDLHAELCLAGIERRRSGPR